MQISIAVTYFSIYKGAYKGKTLMPLRVHKGWPLP